MSPSPIPRHQVCQLALMSRVQEQLPDDLMVMPAVDVDLELVPPTSPGFVRIPDIVVVTRAAFERVDAHGGVFRAADVVLAVEIVVPGSVRTDHTIKRGEYADAETPFPIRLDLDGLVPRRRGTKSP